MNDTEYKLWIRELPSLNQKQLQDLSNRMKILHNTVGSMHVGRRDFGDRVLNAICDVMSHNHVEHPSVALLRRSTAYASAKPKFDSLAEFFDKVSKNRLVQDRILSEGISLLYNDLLQWQGIAISSYTILQQIHRIPSTLNRHFPGYAASGLLTKIVKV